MKFTNISNKLQKSFLSTAFFYFSVFLFFVIVAPQPVSGTQPGATVSSQTNNLQTTAPKFHPYKTEKELPIRPSWIIQLDQAEDVQPASAIINYKELNPKPKNARPFNGANKSAKVQSLSGYPQLTRIILFPFIDDDGHNLKRVNNFLASVDVKNRLDALKAKGVKIELYHYPTNTLHPWKVGFSADALIKELESTKDVEDIPFQKAIGQLLQQTNSGSLDNNHFFKNKPVVLVLWPDSNDNPILNEDDEATYATQNINTSVLVLNIQKVQGFTGGSGKVADMNDFCQQHGFDYREVNVGQNASKDPAVRGYELFETALDDMYTVPPRHFMIELESTYPAIAKSRIFELALSQKKTLSSFLSKALLEKTVDKLFQKFSGQVEQRRYRGAGDIYLELNGTKRLGEAAALFKKYIRKDIDNALKKQDFDTAVKRYRRSSSSPMKDKNFNTDIKRKIMQTMQASFSAKLKSGDLRSAEKQLTLFKKLLPRETAFLSNLSRKHTTTKQRKTAQAQTAEVQKYEAENNFVAALNITAQLSQNPQADTHSVQTTTTRLKNKQLFETGMASLNKGDLNKGITDIDKWLTKQAGSKSVNAAQINDAHDRIFQKIMAVKTDQDKLMGEQLARVNKFNPDSLANYYKYIGKWLTSGGNDQTSLIRKLALLPEFTIAGEALKSVQPQGDSFKTFDLTIGKIDKTLKQLETSYIKASDNDLDSAFINYLVALRANSFLPVIKVLDLFAQQSPDLTGEKLDNMQKDICLDPVLEPWCNTVTWSVKKQADVSFIPAAVADSAAKANIRWFLEKTPTLYNWYLQLPNKDIIKIELNGEPTEKENTYFNMLVDDEPTKRMDLLPLFASEEYQLSTLASMAFIARVTSIFSNLDKPEDFVKKTIANTVPKNLFAYLMVADVDEDENVDIRFLQPSTADAALLRNSEDNLVDMIFFMEESNVIEMATPYFSISEGQKDLLDATKTGIIRAGFKNYAN